MAEEIRFHLYENVANAVAEGLRKFLIWKLLELNNILVKLSFFKRRSQRSL